MLGPKRTSMALGVVLENLQFGTDDNAGKISITSPSVQLATALLEMSPKDVQNMKVTIARRILEAQTLSEFLPWMLGRGFPERNEAVSALLVRLLTKLPVPTDGVSTMTPPSETGVSHTLAQEVVRFLKKTSSQTNVDVLLEAFPHVVNLFKSIAGKQTKT
jgi:hypothetical protein